MKFALFLGCNIPARLVQYESSARAVLKKLDVGLVDIKAFNCCGYPVRNIDEEAFLLSSARNLALAAKENLNIITLCKCCFGSLKKADYLLKENTSLSDRVNDILKKESLRYEGDVEVKHFLSVLYHDVGIEAIKKEIENRFKGLNIATHYGCHALRPSKVVQFDDPVQPSIFDELVEITGAKSIDWPLKLDCCGAPLLGINDDISVKLTEKKLVDGKKAGAGYLCTACPYCQLQFDAVQKDVLSGGNNSQPLPSILYAQLLGLSMGVRKDLLGLDMNQLSLEGIEDFIEVKEETTSKKEK